MQFLSVNVYSNIGATNAVNTPATPMDRLLMAPWISPMVIAVDVPSA